jgi:hypothetical protein
MGELAIEVTGLKSRSVSLIVAVTSFISMPRCCGRRVRSSRSVAARISNMSLSSAIGRRR